MKKHSTAFFMFTFLVVSVWGQDPITIHTAKTGQPISKYIYGQFIEHLGRCIYGGIWAEMLEDRKFYYPVTDTYSPWRTADEGGFWGGGEFRVLGASPWKVIGPEGSVTMVTQNSFTGEHTPVVTVGSNPAGIEQLDVSLEEGHQYTGYVIVSGDTNVAPVHVQLVDESGSMIDTHTIESITRDYDKHPFTFHSSLNTSDARLQIIAHGTGELRIGAVSLMPADNIHGFRPDTLQAMKELDSPVYRWPGGNFVSDYNWKDGVGDRDRRPPRKNPAWTGIEHNDVGIHEFIQLCKLLDTEAFIAVNTGLGSVELAAEQVEYCNGGQDTPMGQWRAENGHADSFDVIWWAVGNEMYGDWQLGHMPLEEYVEKHNRCAEAMYEVDPTIQLIAVGNAGEWSETMMKVCSGHMDLISEHIYHRSQDDLVAHVEQMPMSIRDVADAHREYRNSIPGLPEKDIRIAMDEWNYWYGPYIYGELGCQYSLQDALGVAAGLHEFYRNSDIYFMANYAQTVNVIGAIKTSDTDAQMETTGLVLKLYRHHYGEIPVRVNHVPEPLDVAAALTSDRESITISVVNPTGNVMVLPFQVNGAQLNEIGQRREISGSDKLARNRPDEIPQVVIEENPVSWNEGRLQVAPISVTLFEFEL